VEQKKQMIKKRKASAPKTAKLRANQKTIQKTNTKIPDDHVNIDCTSHLLFKPINKGHKRGHRQFGLDLRSSPRQFNTRRPFKDYYNLNTKKNNHMELYSANSNDQIRSYGVSNQVLHINQSHHLSFGSTPTTILISLTESQPVSNREVTSEHVSDMCKEMKVMFIQSQNPGSAAVAAVLSLNSISSTNEIPSEDDITSFVNDAFLKDIFFTQLAIIKEDELFNNVTIINTLKTLLKKAFMLHLTLEVSHLTNHNVNNHHILQQVKELDHLTSDLTIPNLT
ncbi:17066_t:CDS:2, partial [Funneliformis caledonium]